MVPSSREVFVTMLTIHHYMGRSLDLSEKNLNFLHNYKSVLTIVPSNFTEKEINTQKFHCQNFRRDEQAFVANYFKQDNSNDLRLNINSATNKNVLENCAKNYVFKDINEINVQIGESENLLIILEELSKWFTNSRSCFKNKNIPKIFVQSNNANITGLKFETLNFSINLDIFIVHFNLKRNKTSVWEIYKNGNVSVVKLLMVHSINDLNLDGCDCEKDNGLNSVREFLFENPSSIRRGRDLSKSTIKVVAQNDPDYQPRINTKIYENGTVEFIAGMCLEVLRTMQFMMKFEYMAVDGKGWMGLFPNGTWTGMSGQVVNNEADISISQASTIMMTDQLHGINFLHPTSTGDLIAIFRQPKASSIRDIILSAFHPYTWICYFFIWTLLLICLRISFRIIGKHGLVYNDNDQHFLIECNWWAISTICNLGWHTTPLFFSIRLIFTIGFFLGFFILVGYSASLVTNLSTEKLPVRNVKELIATTSITIFSDKWLPMSHKLMEEMYHQRSVTLSNEESYYHQLESIVPSLLNHTWAFITFPDAISVVFHRLNFTNAFFCNSISTVVASKISYANAMYVKKGSPLREIFNTRILLMIERGQLSRLNGLYAKDTQIRCVQLSHFYRGGLSLRDTSTPFLFIFSGSILSLLILSIERKFRNSRNFKNSQAVLKQN